MTPRVTVLLAVHNGEPYLRDAIESVLDQTYGDFEFVIVDDASTDGTVATIESFDDARMRLLRNERNLGQVTSLNRGLRESRGEIVARIDADDMSRPTRLERQLAVLDEDPRVGLVGSWMTLVDEHGRRVGALHETLTDYVDFLFHTLIMRVYVSHPAAMYRREPVVALGGYDESTGPSEDKDLWRKLTLGRWDARIVPEELVVYRLHDAQLSRTRAAYQREVDARSQERFLAAVAPEVDVASARMLLADDPALWRTPIDMEAALAGIDAIVSGASDRLGIDSAGLSRLRGLVGRWLVGVAARRPWTARARAIAACGLSLLQRDERTAALFAAAPRAVAAPGRVILAGAARRAGSSAPSVRRWRAARRLYGKLLGGG